MNLLGDGILLMVVGMGAVFLFLVIMVLWITFSSRILSNFAHLLPETSTAPAPKRAPAKPAAEEDSTLLAVITAAIHKHRSRR